jgi:signal transduction histidine kinase/ligand-binding sensor domain-containing protein
VEHVEVDRSGVIWVIMGNESITTFGNGQFHLVRQPRAAPRLRAEFHLDGDSNHTIFADEGGRLARLNTGPGANFWELLSPVPPAADAGRAFWTDRAGVIWYLTRDGGLAQYSNQRFNLYSTADPALRTQVKAVTADKAGHFWIATANRILEWNGSVFENRTPTNQVPAARISQITTSPDGGLWVLDGNHLRKCSWGNWSANVSLPQTLQRDNSSHAAQLYSDSAGNAWLIDYGHGLWHVESDGATYDLTENEGLPSAFITSWFEDREANVWVGTAGGGVACIRKRIVRVLGQEANLPGKIARSVCVDKRGVLWAGTMSGGLASWNSNQFVRLPLPNYNASTPLESVTVCPAADGSLWIGSLRQGLLQLRDGKISRPAGTADINSVRTLFEDSQKRLWIGGLADLNCFANGRLRRFGSGEGFPGGVAIGNIAEDALGVIWIGTGPGDLWKFEQGHFTRYSPPKGWPSFRFAALRPDSDGAVWIGTLGGGLLRFKDGQFFRYTAQLGLPNAYVSQLLEDGRGNLWAGTYAGIDRFSKANLNAIAEGKVNQLSCRVYGYSSGLRALECSSGFQPSCWAAPEGRLWWATASGLAYIDLGETAVNHQSPPVVIEEMQVDGVPRFLSPAEIDSAALAGNQAQIAPGRHFLQFRFTGLSLGSPESVQFRVKLDGAENQWRVLHYQRTVGYGPLAPGSYCLHVQACNSEGLWNERGADLPFIVLPFVWQTWWFKLGVIALSFLMTGLLVALTLKRRHRIELQKLKYQNELETERARIAQDLHDDLGTSLTQISLLTALADRKIPEDESKSFNQQIRERSRDMVVALDEIVWAVNPRNDSLAELINYLGSFAEEFFRPTSIRCRLDLPDQLPLHPLSSDTRHHLFLAFKESINNAARYSGASHVWLTVEARLNEVVITVKDDGRGFAPSDKSSRAGNGLLNIRSRMEQLGGRADIQSAPGQGTVVTLKLPLRP